MKTVLQEYKNRTHNANTNDCALCQLYNKRYDDDVSYNGHYCSLCPMFVFYNTNNKYNQYPCMNRECELVECDGSESLAELKRVRKFYKSAISRVKKMSVKQLNEKDAFKFLIKIDQKVFWESDIDDKF